MNPLISSRGFLDQAGSRCPSSSVESWGSDEPRSTSCTGACRWRSYRVFDWCRSGRFLLIPGRSEVAEIDVARIDSRQPRIGYTVGRRTGNNSGDAGTSGQEALSLPLASVVLRLGDDGQVRVEPRDRGWRAIAAVSLIEVMEAQRVDTWRRFEDLPGTALSCRVLRPLEKQQQGVARRAHLRQRGESPGLPGPAAGSPIAPVRDVVTTTPTIRQDEASNMTAESAHTPVRSHLSAPTQFGTANGIRYAYRRFGAGNGTPLIFLQHFRETGRRSGLQVVPGGGCASRPR
jgi:hypothetical protein